MYRIVDPMDSNTLVASEHWNEIPTNVLASRVDLESEDFGGLSDWLESDFYKGRYNKSVLPMLERTVREVQVQRCKIGVLLNGASGMSIALRRMTEVMDVKNKVVDLYIGRNVIGEASMNHDGRRWVVDYEELQEDYRGANSAEEIFSYLSQKDFLDDDSGILVDTAFNGSIIKLVSQVIIMKRRGFRIRGSLALQMRAAGMPEDLELDHGNPFLVSDPTTDMSHFEKLGPRQFSKIKRLVNQNGVWEPEYEAQCPLVDYVFVRQYLENLVEEYLA